MVITINVFLRLCGQKHGFAAFGCVPLSTIALWLTSKDPKQLSEVAFNAP